MYSNFKNQLDEEAEPLNNHINTPTNSNNNASPSWKKWGMGAALVALLGYVAFHHSSSATVPTQDSVDLLGKHHEGMKKHHKKEKHVMTKAEMNAMLFDERRKFSFWCIALSFYTL